MHNTALDKRTCGDEQMYFMPLPPIFFSKHCDEPLVAAVTLRWDQDTRVHYNQYLHQFRYNSRCLFPISFIVALGDTLPLIAANSFLCCRTQVRMSRSDSSLPLSNSQPFIPGLINAALPGT